VHSRPVFLCLTLTLWLGIYALRTFVPAAVWNLADELPLNLKPLLAVATHTLGMLGVIFVFRRRRASLIPIALSFAAVTVLRQLLITVDAVGPWLSMLSWSLWLMLIAAMADEVGAQDEERVVAPALAAAFALQIGMQAAWHGLDLPAVSGVIAVIVALLLGGLLVSSTRNLPVPLLKRPHTSVAWLLLGPAMFLQMTFAANVGRMSQAANSSLFVAVLLMIAAQIAAAWLAGRGMPLWLRIVLTIAAGGAVFAVPRVQGIDGLILLAVPFVIIGGMQAAATRRVRISGATACTIGTLLLFALIFGFYNYYELSGLWVVALIPLVIVMLTTRAASKEVSGLVNTAGVIAILLAFVHLLPPPDMSKRTGEDLTVLSYNIHHGFDDDGVPGMRHTGNKIAAMQPDLVALQEIGRGWTLLGGSDLIAYLRWRFPDYEVFYTPTNGQLWGNAVMTRLPLRSASGATFDARPGFFRYGWTGVQVEFLGAPMLFYSVHLTADLEGAGGDGRVQQANALLEAVDPRFPILIAGDFNALPTDAPIGVLASRYDDLSAQAGLQTQLTWPAGKPNQRIDYIFGRGFRAVSGTVEATPVSDHLPVLLRVRRDATAGTTNPSNRSSQPGQ
jgi:endonuclease/exonuclease/phosphatase family metal-dependent hydrolase